MTELKLEFYLRRGVIDIESIEDDGVRQAVRNVKSFVQNADFNKALAIMPPISFEWVWSNGDGDPGDYFVNVEDFDFFLSSSNSRIRLGVADENLMISVNVQFLVVVKDSINHDEVQEWLDTNSMVYAGFVSGGWPYVADDGSGIRVVP